MKKEAIVNPVIIRSIPMNRKVKRYWVEKYTRVTENCGVAEAVRKFKNLRVQVLTYIADANRKSNLDRYLALAGFRTNGFLLALFQYADTQPDIVLNFLKLYTGPTPLSKSVDEAARALHERLLSVRSQTGTPRYLTSWLKIAISGNKSFLVKVFKGARSQANHPFHYLATNLSLSDWLSYWFSWYRRLEKGWTSRHLERDAKLVFPEVYKDYVGLQEGSSTFEHDLADLVGLHTYNDPDLSSKSLSFVRSELSEPIQGALERFLWTGELDPVFDGVFKQTSVLSGTYVGHCQHIRKKGAGDEYRDIAVPNRFIQQALAPGAHRLYRLVREMPNDATFDQNRFDKRIQNRVNNPNLYQGSVDLSKATDNLPRQWGLDIIDALTSRFHYRWSPSQGPTDEAVELMEREQASLDLFKEVSGAHWEDEGFRNVWKVGQPLGSLPSFAMLAITHNLLVESLAAHLGYRHSPYVILGDDIVIMNKRLRTRYIQELASRAIPLSLHKSFTGRLSEFAGKTYVRNCIPFYCSDHNPLSFNSLFDWQRTTGIRIPWNNLPRRLRRIWRDKASRRAIDYLSSSSPSKRMVRELASSTYSLVQTCYVGFRGSGLHSASHYDQGKSERIAGFFEFLEDKPKVIPDACKHTGITPILGGHPVVLMSTRFADKDGYFQRYRPVELPSWYKAKVRPCATDSVLDAAVHSYMVYDR